MLLPVAAVHGTGTALVRYMRMPAGHAVTLAHTPPTTVRFDTARHREVLAAAPRSAWALHGQMAGPHGNAASGTGAGAAGVALRHRMAVVTSDGLHVHSRPQHDCGSASGAASVDSVLHE